jgi:hypothetical protein
VRSVPLRCLGSDGVCDKQLPKEAFVDIETLLEDLGRVCLNPALAAEVLACHQTDEHTEQTD